MASLAAFKNPPVVLAPSKLAICVICELEALARADGSNDSTPFLSKERPSAVSEEKPPLPEEYPAILRNVAASRGTTAWPSRAPAPEPRFLLSSACAAL